MKTVITLLTLILFSKLAHAAPPIIPESISPNGKIHAVMDIDRDPTISPEWKGDSFPKIEITEKTTGKILVSIEYFGAVGDDERSLRKHVEIIWRADSQAFITNIHDRFYSNSVVYVLNEHKQFVVAPISTLSYEQLTGFPQPDVKHLRPRGRSIATGWDKEGRLIYSLFLSPLPSFTGKDPLQHKVYLDVSATKVTRVKVEHETGRWQRGDWIKDPKDQAIQKTTK